MMAIKLVYLSSWQLWYRFRASFVPWLSLSSTSFAPVDVPPPENAKTPPPTESTVEIPAVKGANKSPTPATTAPNIPILAPVIVAMFTFLRRPSISEITTSHFL